METIKFILLYLIFIFVGITAMAQPDNMQQKRAIIGKLNEIYRVNNQGSIAEDSVLSSVADETMDKTVDELNNDKEYLREKLRNKGVYDYKIQVFETGYDEFMNNVQEKTADGVIGQINPGKKRAGIALKQTLQNKKVRYILTDHIISSIKWINEYGELVKTHKHVNEKKIIKGNSTDLTIGFVGLNEEDFNEDIIDTSKNDTYKIKTDENGNFTLELIDALHQKVDFNQYMFINGKNEVVWKQILKKGIQ